jgi:hypothetical protein
MAVFDLLIRPKNAGQALRNSILFKNDNATRGASA